MERVRWGNVLRALAVVAVLGLVVAWPVLAPEGPRVPSGREVPVVTPAPVAVPTPVATPRPKASPRPARRRPARPVVRRERRAGWGSRRVVGRPAPVVTPAAPIEAPPLPVAPPPPAAPAGAPAPADPDPVLREFSFER